MKIKEVKIKCLYCKETFNYPIGNRINIDHCPKCNQKYSDSNFINDFIDKLVTYDERLLPSIEIQALLKTPETLHDKILNEDLSRIKRIYDNSENEDKENILNIIDKIYLILNREKNRVAELTKIIEEFFHANKNTIEIL